MSRPVRHTAVARPALTLGVAILAAWGVTAFLGSGRAWLVAGGQGSVLRRRDLRSVAAAAQGATGASTLKLQEAPKESKLLVPTPEGGGRLWVNQPGRVSFEVIWEEGDKIKDLKAEIQRITGIPVNKMELLKNGEPLGVDGQLLAGVVTEDVWVTDERDDSSRPGYWSGPDEDDHVGMTGFKGFVYAVFVLVAGLFVAQLNGYDVLQNAIVQYKIDNNMSLTETKAQRAAREAAERAEANSRPQNLAQQMIESDQS